MTERREFREEDMADCLMIIRLAGKACVPDDAVAHGKIVAEVYGYKVFGRSPTELQGRLDEIIRESKSRGNEFVDWG